MRSEDKKREARGAVLDAVFNGYNSECILDEILKHKNDLAKDDFFSLLYQWREYLKYKGAI